MIYPSEMKLIQLEVTNACKFNCSNCSRLIGHQKKPFFMTLEQIENGLKTLEDYPGHIGLMGGEPALHPDFPEICKLYQKHIPIKARRELWTAGHKWDEYKDIIHETFYPELIAFNDHSKPDACWHQPLLIGIQEVVKDYNLMWKIIDNCWVNLRWSASITPYGAFFCEVASARAYLENRKGVLVNKGWWKEDMEFHYQQRMRYCPKCSACLPMEMRINSHEPYDGISPRNLKFLESIKSPKIKRGEYRVCDCKELAEYVGNYVEPETDYRNRGGFKSHPDWHPWNYRPDQIKIHAPAEEGGTLTEKEVIARQHGK
jgi:hypothetical protein